MLFPTIDLFCGKSRARSDWTYVQSDLALHFPLIFHYYLFKKSDPMPVKTLYHTIPTFNDPKEEGFGRHFRKEENAGNEQFVLFLSVFPILSKREIITIATFNFSSANAYNLNQSKKLSFGVEF